MIGHNSQGRLYLDGPGKQFCYHGELIYGRFSFDSQKEADRAVEIANIAYEEGFKQSQYEIRKSLGAK